MMRYDARQRMEGPVTIAHRTGEEWVTTTYPRCAWQAVPTRAVDADGTVVREGVLRVQVPEDVGEVQVVLGDYLIPGELEYSGPLRGLVALLPEGARRVSLVRDLRGGLQGVRGPLARWASVLVLEGSR